jgi:hypothetical protein
MSTGTGFISTFDPFLLFVGLSNSSGMFFLDLSALLPQLINFELLIISGGF